MQVPLFGKVKSSTLWITGLILVGILGTGAVAVVAVRQSRSTIDLSKLTVKVEQENLSVKITASGTAIPIRTVNLSPKTAGILVGLLVEQGDSVQANQVVAAMDSRDLDAQLYQMQGVLGQALAKLAELEAGTRKEDLDQTQAQVAQAQAQVAEAESRLALARQRLGRNESLLQEGAISRDDYDQAVTEANQAGANLAQTQARVTEIQRQLQELQNGPRPEEIAQAQATVREAQGRVAAIQIQKEDTLIRAPFAGVITQRYADPGAFVTPTTSASATASATSTSIVALAQGLEILAKVPEVDIGQIHVGQYVEIQADSYPDQPFKGQVRLIAPEAVKDQDVTSFEVRIGLLTGQQELRSGMNVDVSFLGQTLQNVLVVPTVAIVTRNGQVGVLVPNQKQEPVFRPVTIGTTVGDKTEILEGAEEGDQVFIDLPKGQKFDEIEEEKEPQS
jgi:HlyD family secretion protein